MNVRYLEFYGKHPKEKKENRVHTNVPPSRGDYGSSYGFGFLKLDLDDCNHKTGELERIIKGRPQSDVVVEMLDSLGTRYNGIRTEHGKQLFFRTPEHLERKNRGSRWLCPLGLKCEWKFPESDDHIPLRVNGVERKFFKGSIDNTNIDELPFFLSPMQMDNASFKVEFPEGDRTQHLGGYLFYLVESKGYTADQAFEIVRLMNQYIFDNPIPDDLLNSQILNDSTYRKLLDREQYQKETKLTYAEVAKEIIERFDLITVNGNFYTYEGGVYKPFPDGKITNFLTVNHPSLNSNFEKEVKRQISGLTYTEYPKDDGTVNVKNGILQFDEYGNVTLLPHSKEHITFKQFEAFYDPDAESRLLDDSLNVWFNGDSEQIELFYQVMGYLMMNHVNYQKIFFFIGVPSTGKTTVLKLMTRFCGKENVSTIQLCDMGKNFGLASIVNKIANIFSDIRKTKMLASDIFKMLADGSPIEIQKKYKDPFTYVFTGKMIFGMNEYPDFSNDFDGIERRLVIFEFEHVFKDDECDPALLEKLETEECMSALLNKALVGYKRLIENKGFITTRSSRKALNRFVSDNDTVMQWISESKIDESYLLREPIKVDGYKGLYPDYQSYCINIGETAKAQKDFSRAICNRYGFETSRCRIAGVRVPMFRKK
ncbi:MAG: hypothetical protein KH828_01645 [Clostridiales bacterium]|nr:hypothetical protein [Clostridiales bacterium]